MSRKAFVPIIILLVVVAILAIGGIWYFKAQPISTQPNNSQTTAVSTSTRKSESNINIGDTVGAFTVQSISRAVNDRIVYAGQTSVIGHGYAAEGILRGLICFDVASEDLWKIPRVKEDQRNSATFCFDGGIPSSTMQTFEDHQSETITIQGYTEDFRGEEVSDQTHFVTLGCATDASCGPNEICGTFGPAPLPWRTCTPENSPLRYQI